MPFGSGLQLGGQRRVMPGCGARASSDQPPDRGAQASGARTPQRRQRTKTQGRVIWSWERAPGPGPAAGVGRGAGVGAELWRRQGRGVSSKSPAHLASPCWLRRASRGPSEGSRQQNRSGSSRSRILLLSGYHRERPQGPGLKAGAGRGHHGVGAEPGSTLPASSGAAAPLPGVLTGGPDGGLRVCGSVILYASLNTPGGKLT